MSSLNQVKDSYFNSYLDYCNYYHTSIKSANLSVKDMLRLNQVIENIILIFNLTREESMTHIFNFFIKKEYLNYSKPVNDVLKIFPKSFN